MIYGDALREGTDAHFSLRPDQCSVAVKTWCEHRRKNKSKGKAKLPNGVKNQCQLSICGLGAKRPTLSWQDLTSAMKTA